MSWFKKLFGSGPSGGMADSIDQYKKIMAETMGLFNNQYKDAFPTDPYNNPYANQFQSLVGAQLAGSDKAMADLPGALQKSAVTGTQNATIASMMAARSAGAGRGGLGFGGGGAALAAQMAQQSSATQGAALSQAQLQGLQMQSNYGMQRSSMLADAMKTEASLGENRITQALDFRKNLLQGSMGLGQAALTQGLQGESARNANSRLKLFGVF